LSCPLYPKPLLFIFNVFIVYMRLRAYEEYSASKFVGDLICFALSFWGYTSIVDDYANAGSGAKTIKNKNDKQQKEALTGGDSLDLLAMVVVVQLGTIFSSRFWWGLLVLVAWVIYKLYALFGTLTGALRGRS
jgi:hypothetical protein